MNNIQHYTIWTILLGFAVALLTVNLSKGLILHSLIWLILLIADITFTIKYYQELTTKTQTKT